VRPKLRERGYVVTVADADGPLRFPAASRADPLRVSLVRGTIPKLVAAIVHYVNG
jgi:hypothetical protein